MGCSFAEPDFIFPSQLYSSYIIIEKYIKFKTLVHASIHKSVRSKPLQKVIAISMQDSRPCNFISTNVQPQVPLTEQRSGARPKTTRSVFITKPCFVRRLGAYCAMHGAQVWARREQTVIQVATDGVDTRTHVQVHKMIVDRLTIGILLFLT